MTVLSAWESWSKYRKELHCRYRRFRPNFPLADERRGLHCRARLRYRILLKRGQWKPFSLHFAEIRFWWHIPFGEGITENVAIILVTLQSQLPISCYEITGNTLPVWKFLSDLADEQCSHSGTSTATQRMSNLKSLQAVTPFCLFSDTEMNLCNQF